MWPKERPISIALQSNKLYIAQYPKLQMLLRGFYNLQPKTLFVLDILQWTGKTPPIITGEKDQGHFRESN